MCEYYLKTSGMEVGYGKNVLLRGIDIEVKRGEILTIIGPNGAGKSTILKSITRQLSLMGGVVYIEKNDMQTFTDKELSQKLSVVLTKQIQSELMTCEDVVSGGRYPYTGRLGILSERDREKVWEALNLVGATDLASLYFDKMSDGQRQKVLLARAICQEPEIIVLDEPTSFLDIRHKMELLTILKQLVRKRKIAVVMSLHELEFAQKIADRIACVNDKGIEKCGTPEEIFLDDYICQLYHIQKGCYLSEYGLVELERVEGVPKVFIIGGGGSGISLYRKLQREEIPFVVGVLSKSDADYPIARALAQEIIEEKAFEPVSEQQVEKALEKMRQCEKVYCTVQHFGSTNKENKRLVSEARKLGILCEVMKQ